MLSGGGARVGYSLFFSVLAVVNWQVARKRRPPYTSARFFALPVGSPLS